MKFKTTAIALAVAGTVAAPVAVQAGADEIYASARVGLVNTDTGGISEMRVRSMASRFGMKGETDLGNGMSGFGKYEWDVDMEGGASPTLRHRIVGLKGDFGSVTLGQTYHTFYNHVVGPLDLPWWGSGYQMISYTGRTGDAISYAGSAGSISFGLTGYFSPGGEEGLDGTEVGATFGIGDMNLGVAIQDLEVNADAATGIALSGIALGDASIGISYQVQGDDSGFVIDAGIASAYVHIEALSNDVGPSPMMFTLGYTQSLGRKTTAWYEFQSTDMDTANSDDDVTVIRAMLKYDII